RKPRPRHRACRPPSTTSAIPRATPAPRTSTSRSPSRSRRAATTPPVRPSTTRPRTAPLPRRPTTRPRAGRSPGRRGSPPPSTCTFLPSVTSQMVNVSVNGDTAGEPDENFYVNLSNPQHATIADGQGLGTIVNDDGSAPSISISDVTRFEGNSGTTNFDFLVDL